MPKGINIAEQCKVVPLRHPTSGWASTDIINMANYSHASIFLMQGVGASAVTVTVRCSDDVSSSNTSAISFQYYSEATSGGDTLGARTSAGTAGFSLTSGSNQFAVIEVEASELSSGKPYLLVNFSASGKSLGAAYAVLSGPRYANDQSPTVLT